MSVQTNTPNLADKLAALLQNNLETFWKVRLVTVWIILKMLIAHFYRELSGSKKPVKFLVDIPKFFRINKIKQCYNTLN